VVGKFLKYYLAITGLAAIFTLAAPGLVFMLAFIGVGLILAMTPTAFMWGCIFALGYRVARFHLRPVSASGTALVVTAAILWAIPQPSIRAANAALARFHLDNVTPAELIRLEGDVRIDMSDPQSGEASRDWPGIPTYRCDNRCIAILFEPGVRSVTITRAQPVTFDDIRDEVSHPDNSSRTYRLVPKAQCRDEGIAFDPRRINGRFGATVEDRRAVAAEWSMKFATEYCLTGEVPLNRYDTVLRTVSWQSQGSTSKNGADWWTRLTTAQAHFSDVRNSMGEVLFRRYNLVADALSVPLMLLPGEDFRIGWSRRFLPPHKSTRWEETDEALDAAIVVKRTAAIGDSVANARTAVQLSFVDSAAATAQSATLLIQNYMEMLAKTTPSPEDVAMVDSLLRDQRLDDLPGAWLLYRSFSPDQLNSFLSPIISKLSMARSAEPVEENRLGSALKHWPKAAFENPDHATLELLANPALRLRAIGLVSRMSDMGERGAPLLVDIIEHHVNAAAELEGGKATGEDSIRAQMHRRTADAAISAMCYMGPQGARELPRMREMERTIPLNSSQRAALNDVMLRLGKPVAEMKRPENYPLTQQDYLKGLMYRLEHFNPDQDCRDR